MPVGCCGVCDFLSSGLCLWKWQDCVYGNRCIVLWKGSIVSGSGRIVCVEWQDCVCGRAGYLWKWQDCACEGGNCVWKWQDCMFGRAGLCVLKWKGCVSVENKTKQKKQVALWFCPLMLHTISPQEGEEENKCEVTISR